MSGSPSELVFDLGHGFRLSKFEEARRSFLRVI